MCREAISTTRAWQPWLVMSQLCPANLSGMVQNPKFFFEQNFRDKIRDKMLKKFPSCPCMILHDLPPLQKNLTVNSSWMINHHKTTTKHRTNATMAMPILSLNLFQIMDLKTRNIKFGVSYFKHINLLPHDEVLF